MIAKEPENTFERILLDAGTYNARCYSLIDLGMQSYEWQGNTIEQRKIQISFEIPSEMAVFDEKKGEQPHSVHKEFTLSLAPKAKLKEYLESWRGKNFTQAELDGFDVTTLLGVPCTLGVVHSTSKKGIVYAEIGSLSKLMKDANMPPQINETVLFDLENPDMEVYANLPKFLKEKIALSPEYQALMGIQSASGTETQESPAELPDEDNDLPF